MPPDQPTAVDVAEALLNEHGAAIVAAGMRGELPPEAVDATEDLTGALHDTIAAGRQLDADLAELRQRKDLLPKDGYDRLVAEANASARAKSEEGELAAGRAYDRLETTLQNAAMPVFAPGREQLARDEAALALSGDANPVTVANRLALDEHGGDEALAALVTPWGRTLLAARGVSDVDHAHREIRSIALQRLTRHGANPAARALRDHLPKIGTAKGVAGSRVRTEIDWGN